MAADYMVFRIIFWPSFIFINILYTSNILFCRAFTEEKDSLQMKAKIPTVLSFAAKRGPTLAERLDSPLDNITLNSAM